MTETKKTTNKETKKPEKATKISKELTVVDMWRKCSKSGRNRTDDLLEAMIDKIGLN